MLLAIGNSFVIDNGKLEITPNEWLEPIAKGYKELETEYFRLEPEKRLDNYEENRDLQPIRVKWGHIVDDVRTAVYNKNKNKYMLTSSIFLYQNSANEVKNNSTLHPFSLYLR
ncbi:hypothetical protein AGMMS49556_10180 [Endomicrobiia bacterium]|nr:hypothetical protein AGMMS49556_10180 [Endomicrobiia bacterium]